MKYLLDTSVIAELISKRPNLSVVEFVDSLDQGEMYLSVITLGEIVKGIEKLSESKRKQDLKKWLREELLVRFEGNIISLDAEIFIRWGELTAKLEKNEITTPAIDSLIAATVLTHKMILVTMNDIDFEKVNIEIINPSESEDKLPTNFKEGDFFERNNENQIAFIFPETIGVSRDIDKGFLEAKQKISLALQSGWTELDLSNMGLTTLPESLAQLTGLKTLNLSNNQLITLPDFLGKLVNLGHLNLYHNKINSLPNAILSLPNLQELGIGYNPPTIMSQAILEIKNLTMLGIAGLELEMLPEQVGNLSNLEKLSLYNNQFTDFPSFLIHLAKLNELDIRKNHLNSELEEINKQGVESIKAYISSKLNSEPITLNEAKLIIVGEGEVGKSCLVDALLDKEWQEHPSTHGIDIKSLKVIDLISNKEIALNSWDFGGQRVYRPTHQLFFSAPAVYLVVWKPREGLQQGSVKEWIQLIRRREPSAKIIVVATHGGPQQRQPDIDRQGLWDLFGKDTVVGFFWVDSKPNDQGKRKGIEELKAAIARVAAELPEVGRSVPKSFADVRSALTAKNAPYLPLDEVLAICHTYNMDDEIARLFITVSHRLGHLTHYENDSTLRDIVILRPDWLAIAISYVLDDEQTRNSNGVVDFTHLSFLWNNTSRPPSSRYPKSLHRIFLRLMERFDLSYRVEGLSSETDLNPISLIAQLVPDRTPEKEKLDQVWALNPNSGDIEQTQVCHIVDAQNRESADAEGLFYQLIVRLHRYSLGRFNHNNSIHWQHGLIIDADYNGRAFLRHIGNDVHITVRAAFPQGLLTILTEEVRYLVENSWEGLRCEITVPCLNPKPCKGLFEVSKLIENKKQKHQELPCSVCNYWQDVDELLSNVPAATQPISENNLYAKFINLENEIYSIRPSLEKHHEEVIGKFSDVRIEIQELFSQAESKLNFLMQNLSDEAKEGPRLFSLAPVERDRFDPRNWITSRFRLILWCEHSRLPLPALNQDKNKGVYEFDITRQWLKEYSPLINAFTITLKSLLPVAFSASKLALDSTVYEDIKIELDFSKACLDSLISEGEGISTLFAQGKLDDEILESPFHKVVEGQNSTLREFHSLLNKIDPTRKYGDLFKVINKQEKFMWVHEKFKDAY